MTAPGPADPAAQARLIVTATSVSYAVIMLDASIVTVALGDIAGSMAANLPSLQWVANAYTVSFATLLLTGGVLGDRWGARTVYLAGLAVFTAASAACGLAMDLGMLVAARVLQGVGAALLVPCALKLIDQAFPEPGRRSRAIGIWIGWGGLAMAAGPLVGGVLIHLLGWRTIFFVNLPAGLLGLGATWRLTDDSGLGQVRPFDLAGLATSALALAAAIGVLIEGPDFGWDARLVLPGLAVALVAGGAFLWAQARVAAPSLPPALFESRIFSASTGVSLLSAGIFYGFLFASGLHLRQDLGYSALRAGTTLLPMTAAVACGSFVSGRVLRWCGVRGSLCAAFGVYGLGAAGLAMAGWDSPTWLAVLPLLAIGLAAGFISPAATAPALAAVTSRNTGVAAAILNAARQTGAAFGVALSGVILATIHPSDAALRAELGAMIALSLAGGTVWWRAMGSVLRRDEPDPASDSKPA